MNVYVFGCCVVEEFRELVGVNVESFGNFFVGGIIKFCSSFILVVVFFFEFC